MKTFLSYNFSFLPVAIGTLLTLMNCAKPGETEKTTSGAPASVEAIPSPSPTNEQSSDVVVQPSGNLQISFADAALFDNIRVQVVGSETSYQLKALVNKPGSFELSPPLSGQHDVLLFAESKQTGNAPKLSYGLRLSGLDIPQGKGLVLSQVQLIETFSLTGKVLLQSPGSVLPEISIKGTSFKTSADAQGNFTISGVPAGSHELNYVASGYTSGLIARSHYSTRTTLPNITLFADSKTLNEGISYLGNPLAKDIAVRVTCALRPPADDYDSMRVGLSEELESSNWQSLRSSLDLNLKEQVRTVYVQFSREGRQPSRVYSVLIPSP